MKQLSTEQVLKPQAFWLSPAWQGAFWKIFSCACFAGINGVIRYCSGGSGSEALMSLPIPTLMFFQNLFGTLFLLPWVFKAGGIPSLSTRYPGLHMIRVITAVAGIYLLYMGFRYMPIAEGVALQFTGPIFTVIAACIFLKEKLSSLRLLSIILSLSGAFIISRPDTPFLNGYTIGWAALLPVGSAIVLVWSKLLTRKLGLLGETPISLATYLLLLMAPISLIPALYDWQMPTISHWPWLILLGALAAGAHWGFGKAYRLAEVTFLAPIGFSKFFFSMLVGYLAFAEWPNNGTLWMGILLIFGSIGLLGYKKPVSSP